MPATAALPIEPAPSPTRNWTKLQCWAFRVVCVYFILDALPDLLLRLPGGPAVLDVYWRTWNAVLPWFGAYVLQMNDADRLVLPISGALLGDFAGAYVLMLLFFLLALIVATAWTIGDRHRSNHRRMHGLLRIYVRYALAFSMLGYGISKLFHVQFRSLDLVDLMTPLGMLQPRELLWDYMGFSRTYQIFTGVVECVGVALIFFRRTTLLGSLILIGALLNVLLVDIAYGVSVKRIALRLLLMAVFLAAVDWRRLAQVFLLHRPAAPVHVDQPLLASPWAQRAAFAAKIIIIVGVVGSRAMEFYHERTLVTAARPELYGVFSVQRMLRDGTHVASGDSRNWNWIAVDGRSAALGSADGRWERRRAEFDADRQVIVLSSGRTRNALTYSLDGDTVTIAGTLDDQQTEIVLRRLAEPRFTLLDQARR